MEAGGKKKAIVRKKQIIKEYKLVGQEDNDSKLVSSVMYKTLMVLSSANSSMASNLMIH